jgi:hypothetical protein
MCKNVHKCMKCNIKVHGLTHLPEFKEALQPWIFKAVTYTTNFIFLIVCYCKDLFG